MQEWLIQLVTSHPYFVYFIIIVLACAEGPILSLIVGVLVKLGYFSFIPMYLALMFGDVLGDAGWYWVGRRYGHAFIKRFGKYFSVTEEGVIKVTKIFHKYKHHILIISKITNGFGFALVTLITAGLVKIPFLKYVGINIIGQFVWTGLLIGVGYFFGDAYMKVDSIIGKLSIFALFVVIFVAFMGYKKYLREYVDNRIN